ncbi:DUF4424 domain-containing protein [Sinorhizobium sp. RAC02]|uniref:DUF4424 domain-containing protein n=1 Tax=Sinorhizobium sp. RAC02 TaxID=1842534 RepID=UPI00083D14F2|nr:DUF4424 domain-containing protein [Sinorhizobium sp. RAC02]AOF91787.1 hypothetical protein BSY16_2105 [Sinorhizobium sp. RAC02]
MKNALRLLPLLLALSAAPAFANDTMAELKTGGLTFVRTPDVEMTSEALFISPQEIRVDYVFTNTSGKEVSGLVAFPMPDIGGDPYANIAIDDFETDNYLAFTASQDGKAVTTNLQQRAYASDIDVTEDLKAQGISLLPYAKATKEALKKLPDDVAADWIARGLIFIDTYDDDGTGMKDYRTPLWSLKSVYWWRTTFPSGREVKVQHRYRPSVGGTVGISFLEEGKAKGERYEDYVKRYCIEDSIVRRAEQAEKDMQAGKPYLTESWISYILTTGANWNGPIKDFSLTIDKGAAENLVSFCGEGVKKTGPTTFEMKAKDFSPDKDIEILLLKPSGAQ